MNKLAFTIVLGFLFLTFSCCSSSKISNDKNFQNKTPFKVTEASFKTWVGGQPSVKGYLVKFEIDNSEVVLDTVYFRNMKATFKKDLTSLNNTFIASFVLPNRFSDIILHKDPKKEFGNEPPKLTKNTTFILNDNEAVIVYNFNNKTEYYKVANLVEIKNTSKN